MCQSRSDLIENVERFTRIDLDLSDCEKERIHWSTKIVSLLSSIKSYIEYNATRAATNE